VISRSSLPARSSCPSRAFRPGSRSIAGGESRPGEPRPSARSYALVPGGAELSGSARFGSRGLLPCSSRCACAVSPIADSDGIWGDAARERGPQNACWPPKRSRPSFGHVGGRVFEGSLWNWAFPRAKLEPGWRFLIAMPCAIRGSGWRWTSPPRVVIPPGGTELTATRNSRSTAAQDLVGRRCRVGGRTFSNAFSLPTHGPEPHYYLSLLGTHPEHRVRGLWMRLLLKPFQIDRRGCRLTLSRSTRTTTSGYERFGFTRSRGLDPRTAPPLGYDDVANQRWRGGILAPVSRTDA